MHLIVTEDGHGTNVKPSLVYGPDEQATEGLENWRFRPAVGPEDKPVPVWTDVEVDFQMKQPPGCSRGRRAMPAANAATYALASAYG